MYCSLTKNIVHFLSEASYSDIKRLRKRKKAQVEYMKGHGVFEPLHKNLTENIEVVLTKQKHLTKLQVCKAWTKSTKKITA